MKYTLPDTASFLLTEDCNLRCTYCLTGDSLISMSDFSQKPIKDIKIGDEILGFDEYIEEGSYRKLKPAIVEQVFHRKAEVIRIVLENGSELYITENHKILNSKTSVTYSWIESGKCKVGEKIRVLESEEISFSKIKQIEYLDNEEDVYNIGTTTRTYIANNVCVHNCFEKHNKIHMSSIVAKKALEMLCENVQKNGMKRFHAMLFGGEPLLQPKLMKEIFDYGLELADKTGTQFTASMVTNATVMNDEIFEMLSYYRDKVGLNIQLSVDGVKEVHDEYRLTINGKGSFYIVEKNIPKFKKIFKGAENRLSIHGCINKKTMSRLYDNYHFFKYDWGFQNIWFMPVHEEDWDINDIREYEKQLMKITDDELRHCKIEKSTEPMNRYVPINKCLSNVQGFPSAPCGAGRGFITVTSKGDIYPCHHFYFSDPEELKIGDVFEGIDDYKRMFFLKYDNQDMTCDDNCTHYNCYRCIAVNHEFNGSPISQIRGNYCTMSRVEVKVKEYARRKLEDMGLIKRRTKQRNTQGKEAFTGTLRGNIVTPDFDFVEAWIDEGRYKERFVRQDGVYKIMEREARPDDINIPEGTYPKGQQNQHSCKNDCEGCGGNCGISDNKVMEQMNENFDVIGDALGRILRTVDKIDKQTEK